MNLMSNAVDFIDLTSGLAADAKVSVALADAADVDAVLEALRRLRPLASQVLLVVGGHDLTTRVADFTRVLAATDLQNERLVDAMFTLPSTASSAAATQQQRNAEVREELANEFELRDSEQVAKDSGSRARNRSATASRWLAEKRIVAVDHRGAKLFPGFQFGPDGKPRPVIKRVLEQFEPYGLTGWEIALWFTTATGWLDDKRPVDLLTKSPDEIVDAARHAFEDITR
jgi:hypothetical protein